MKKFKILATIFICTLVIATSCDCNCNDNTELDPSKMIVNDSTINCEPIGKFDWSVSRSGYGSVGIFKATIGNHEYLFTDHSKSYTIGICHYEDCKYCKEHIVKAELVD